MCFEFSSCFGGGITDDYGGCGGRGRGRRGDHRNGSVYNGAADHKPATAYVHQPAVDEAGRKAHHDGAWKPDHAGAGGHGYYAYAPDKAHQTPKVPAWHNKVGNDASYAYNTGRLHQAAVDDREHAAMDYHHYPTTTTTLLCFSTLFGLWIFIRASTYLSMDERHKFQLQEAFTTLFV